jgi:hypothetical protein
MKYLFGNPREYKQNFTIEAKTLDHAIKLFKVEVLFPETCVAPEFIAKKEYRSGCVPEYEYEWQGTPLIHIWTEAEKEDAHGRKYQDWVKVGSVALSECIDVDYSTLLPQNRQLLPAHDAAPEDDTEELVPVIGKPSSLSALPKMALRTIESEIAAQKRQCELEMRRLHDSLELLRDEVLKKSKMLRLLLTYLGVNEDVVQIADGEPAKEDEPLVVFQQKLFCDEELGIWEDGGLDIQHIEDFDKWEVKNIDTFLYRQRSVVAWQVRRREKHYCEDKLDNFFLNLGNRTTYLLIRNGQQIYRIWSDITIPGSLFPTKLEYEKIMADGFGNEEYKKKKLQAKHESYMFGLVAIQGLIERTDILGPGLRGKVNLIKNQLGTMVELVRDAEPEHFLGDGNLRWREFLEKNQATIEVGSRVSLVGDFRGSKDYPNDWRTEPFRPGRLPSPTEVCIVTEAIPHGHFGDKGDWKTYYSPRDEVWGWQDDGRYWRKWASRIRKRRVSFKFYTSEALNIDTITAEDCEYYERSRLDRADYLDLLRVIHFVKHIKMEERKLEEEFVKLVAGRLGAGDDKFPLIRENIQHWKMKNKWKRGLMVDDAKALRMIERRCRKELSC